jgi:hypothetical protein
VQPARQLEDGNGKTATSEKATSGSGASGAQADGGNGKKAPARRPKASSAAT